MKQQQALETNETVHKAITRLLSIEKEVSELEDALIRHRFTQGVILKPFSDLNAQTRYGMKILQSISSKTGISTGILRMAENLASMFEYDEQKLDRTLTDLRKNNKKPSLSLLFRGRPLRPKDSLSEESLLLDKDHDLYIVERGAEALEIAKKKYGSDDDEVRGVEMAFGEALLGNNALLGEERIYAPKNWIEYHNPKYEEFLATQPCCITGAVPVTLLHWAFTNDGASASDFLTLPIDTSLEEDFRRLGALEFFRKYDQRPLWTCLRYIQEFIKQETVPF